MDSAEARQRFASSRVARLATVDGQGRPHVVPIVFTVVQDSIYFAIDRKPKRTTTELKRLRNIAANQHVCVLVDHYDDHDWTALWWARADGAARVVEGRGEAERITALLAERYPQYRDEPPPGPVVAITVERWSGWSFTQS